MCKKFTINKLLIVPAICFSFIMAVTIFENASADSPPVSGNAQIKLQFEKVEVTLQKKSSKMVRTYAGDQYQLDPTTIVMNAEGEQIKLEYLLVPCQAQLLYEKRANGSNFVHRIKVIRTEQDATNHMEDPLR